MDISDLLSNYDEDTDLYADPGMWLGGPSAADDFVLSVDLRTTVVHPDLSTEIIEPEHADDTDLDVFYVHPTVNLTDQFPGNDDLSDLTVTKSAVRDSAARFSTIGRVIVPLYRSANTPCLLVGGDTLDQCLEVAYQDVEDAFQHYLANDWNGRKLAIVGYSQGAVMVRMLFARLIAGHPDLMSRIVVVMPIGGDLRVDSLDAVPPCESESQTGCYVAYNSFLEGDGPQSGTVVGGWVSDMSACVSPTPSGVYSLSYFMVPQQPGMLPTDAITPPPIEFETPYFAFPDYFTANCLTEGRHYLEVGVTDPADPRWMPILLGHPWVSTDPPMGLGLHLFDFSLAMGDLLDLVETKAKLLDDEEDYCVVQ